MDIIENQIIAEFDRLTDYTRQNKLLWKRVPDHPRDYQTNNKEEPCLILSCIQSEEYEVKIEGKRIDVPWDKITILYNEVRKQIVQAEELPKILKMLRAISPPVKAVT